MNYLIHDLAPEYRRLWATMEVAAGKKAAADKVAARIAVNRWRYEAVAEATGVPWYLIGIIHNLECGGRFDRHLHNGDPLKRKTVRVPRGRPPGPGPWTWEESAIDAIKLTSLQDVSKWDIPGVAYALERYNGFGYRRRGINSPYLWSISNHYKRGKYIEDGKFSATAVSSQIGGMVLLKALEDAGHIQTDVKPLAKSKIAAGAAAVTATGAGTAIDQVMAAKANADALGLTDLLLERRWVVLGVMLTIIGLLILYWRWRDHGRGAGIIS